MPARPACAAPPVPRATTRLPGRGRPGRLLLAVAAAAAVLPVLPHLPGARAALPVIGHRTLHFAVTVGPANDQHCDVVADLYTPPGVDRRHPAAAILSTNGFGGSKDDQAGWAQQFGRAGYVFLSYSGLGFGGSGCKIELDDRDVDGKAGSQLVDFLGGKSGGAFLDAAHTQPVPAPDYVVRDDLAHRPASDGRIHRYDPRVGMIGGSYGGEIQFAVAGVDPRVDTIIPQITWNDLSYSLAPSNGPAVTGVTYPDTAPGVEKVDWVSLFFGVGIADGAQGAQGDPSRLVGCPNFDTRACPAKAEMDALGYPTADTLAFARHASVATYLDRIRIPVLLSQGQADTLFTLREADATFRALRARHVPVAMIWQEWGHSGPAAAHEVSNAGGDDPHAFYDNARYLGWFDHYLRGVPGGTGPLFAYYRDWVPAGATGLADPRYAASSVYPPTAGTALYLSGGAAAGAGTLVTSPAAAVAGSQPFAVPAAGAPTSYTEVSALDQTQPVRDTPGTFAAFSSTPLARPLTLVGSPTLTVRLSAPTYAVTQAAGAPGQLVLFAKLYDVAPDGTITLVHRLISPVRVADVTAPLRITLPAIVHRVPAGDHLELVLAAGDAAYRGTDVAGAVQVLAGAASTLTLPVVAG